MNRRFAIVTASAIVAFASTFVLAGDIHDAARDGYLEEVKRLTGTDNTLVSARDDDGSTPLHWACRGEFPELVAYLVENGADVNAVDNNAITPLHRAAARGYVDLANYLLDRGANVDAADYDNKTPLHHAAVNGCAQVAAVLVERGAAVDARNVRDRTPLLLAARESGDVETGRVLLDAGADINAVDKYGTSALNLSAWRGYEGFVDLLIDRGVDIPSQGRASAHLMEFAVSKGLSKLFAELTDRGADTGGRSTTGGSLVHSAASGGDADIVARLIDAGLGADRADNYGWYPIHYAAENGHFAAIGVLLERGAAIDTRNLCGESAYNLAVKEGKDQAAAFLAGRGADTAAPKFPELTGDYMGQEPPGDEPRLFARGIVSSKFGLHTPVVFSPRGDEAYWPVAVPIPQSGYARGVTFHSRVENGRWTPPQMAAFNTADDNNGDPTFSPDGNRLYFLSTRPLEKGAQSGGENIWYVERTVNGWSTPVPVGDAVNSADIHWQFSVASNGNLYFGSSEGGGYGQNDVYVSRFVDGRYATPENLGTSINTTGADFSPFVAPDESYLIITRSNERGNVNLYISFRKADGTWTPATALPAPVNTGADAMCGVVTPDGKYLFFLSQRGGVEGAYWMKADLIETLREQAL